MTTESNDNEPPKEKSGWHLRFPRVSLRDISIPHFSVADIKSQLSHLHWPQFSRRTYKIAGAAGTFAIVAGVGLYEVTNSSLIQTPLFNRAAKDAAYTVVPAGPDVKMATPPHGPADKRHGYAQSAELSYNLESAGYPLVSQANSKTPSVLGIDLYPIYKKKPQTGLTIVSGDTSEVVYQNRFPREVYPDFQAIPPMLAKSLALVEDKGLLDEHPDTWNPTIDWGRVLRALVVHDGSGGSGLGTQNVKFDNSPDGRTSGMKEKLKQMLTSSVQAKLYPDAPEQFELDYMNGVPFSSYPGFGEVIGFADAMELWFAEDFTEANRLMMLPQDKMSDAELAKVAKVYREALSLVMAVKKPTGFLTRSPETLQGRVDNFLPLLVKNNIISQRFADAVRKARPEIVINTHKFQTGDRQMDKSIQSLRLELLRILKVHDGLYGMERMDIGAKTTEDASLNRAITRTVNDLVDPAKADKLGFVGYQLLPPGRGQNVGYAVTMMERLPDGTSVVRAQTDNFKGQLNINEGSRFQLGSTSKPPTAYLYLLAMKEMHDLYEKDPVAFANLHTNANDPIAIWAKDYLLRPDTDKSLDGIVKAAMQRKYSGSPNDAFYTAGGLHRFENFESKENYQEYTVEDALVHSVNLCFIRIMRDVENYIIDQKLHIDTGPDGLYKDLSNPLRQAYLQQFAMFEGGQFLGRAWEEQNGLTADETASMLAAKTHRTAANLAVIYKATHPNATPEQIKAFIVKEKGGSESQDFSKYNNYGPESYGLNDLIYLSSLDNPFDYWLAAYKAQNPHASRKDAFAAVNRFDAAGNTPTLEIYKWMLHPKNMREGVIDRQNLNIQTILEQEAFKFVRRSWAEIGYPFADIVPSYASSIGVSGNTPKALAEFMGIIGSGGLRTTPIRFTEIKLAEGTPYEKTHAVTKPEQVRVMPEEIAHALRQAMTGVVSDGTARRAYHSITLADGHVLTIYGKTGTGDNREGDVVKNRTATFMFNIDDRFYGTVLAYVDGPEAKDYKFTSALAAQLFKIIVNTPEVKDFLNRSYGVAVPAVKADATAKAPLHLAPAPGPR